MTAHNSRRTAPTYLFFDRSRGAWYLRFRYVDALGRVHWPRERSPHPVDERASLRWAPVRRAEIIRAIEAELAAVDPDPERTLCQVLATYEADCKGRGVDWDHHEAYRAAVLLEGLGASTPWSQLTPAAIEALRVRLRDTRAAVRIERLADGTQRRRRAPLSARTLNAYTTLLQAALNLAVRRREIPHNPLAGLGRLKEAEAEPVPFSDPQLAAILGALEAWHEEATAPQECIVERGGVTYRRRRPGPTRPRARLRERVLLGYYAFARPEALDALRWRDVDLERRVLVFARTKGHRQVVVPLEPPAVDCLRRLRESLTPSPAPADLVLGGVRDYRKSWVRLIALANRRLPAGETPIPLEARLHNLRHTRITNALRDGMTPQAVAQLAGTSIRMIYTHYARYLEAALREEIDRAASRRREREGGQTSGQTPRLSAPRKMRQPVRRATAQPPDDSVTN